MPTRVALLDDEGVVVAKVSAGFHHTLVLAVPSHRAFADEEMSAASSPLNFQSKVFAFGYNEYGRLGNGSETQSNVPVLVEFPSESFHATDVSILSTASLNTIIKHIFCLVWEINIQGSR